MRGNSVLDRKMNKMNLLTLRAGTAPHPRKFDGRFNVLFERWRRGRRSERGATSSDPHAEMRGPKPLRVSALLSAPRCDTTQLLFIPIRLAPIWVIHSGYADPRPRPKCTPQCLLGRRTRKNGVFRLLSCFPVSFSYSVYLIMEIVACFFWLVLLSIRLLLFHKRFQLR